MVLEPDAQRNFRLLSGTPQIPFSVLSRTGFKMLLVYNLNIPFSLAFWDSRKVI